MRYNGVIQWRFSLLNSYLLKLKDVMDGVSRETFFESWEKQRAVERSLQVCVEVVIDVAERIIAMEGAGPVATAGEALQTLVKLKIIETDDVYSDMIKFRNFIVHQYEEIDAGILYDLVTTRLPDFYRFRDEIDKVS